MKKLRVAILGATGLVGQEFIKVLLERNFPMSSLRLLASAGFQHRLRPAQTFSKRTFSSRSPTRSFFPTPRPFP